MGVSETHRWSLQSSIGLAFNRSWTQRKRSEVFPAQCGHHTLRVKTESVTGLTYYSHQEAGPQKNHRTCLFWGRYQRRAMAAGWWAGRLASRGTLLDLAPLSTPPPSSPVCSCVVTLVLLFCKHLTGQDTWTPHTGLEINAFMNPTSFSTWICPRMMAKTPSPLQEPAKWIMQFKRGPPRRGNSKLIWFPLQPLPKAMFLLAFRTLISLIIEIQIAALNQM